MVLFAVLNVSAAALGQSAKAQEVTVFAFEKLAFNECNGSCILTPQVGSPFKIEYKFTKKPIEEGGTVNLVEVKLNDKEFALQGVAAREGSPLPFTQCLFFEDHHFQIYKMASYASTRTLFSYYFLRRGDTFHLLTDEPIPELSYDYVNNGGRRELGRFYGDLGMGGYDFTGGQSGVQSHTRFYFSLEGNRLVQTEARELR